MTTGCEPRDFGTAAVHSEEERIKSERNRDKRRENKTGWQIRNDRKRQKANR
jgi:hypothetical protein